MNIALPDWLSFFTLKFVLKPSMLTRLPQCFYHQQDGRKISCSAEAVNKELSAIGLMNCKQLDMIKIYLHRNIPG